MLIVFKSAQSKAPRAFLSEDLLALILPLSALEWAAAGGTGLNVAQTTKERVCAALCIHFT